MNKSLILFALIFQFANLHAQHIYQDPIDSLIESFPLGNQDWIVGLTIDRGGTHYYENGNPEADDPNGTFILKKIKDTCYLQRVSKNYRNERYFLEYGSVIKIYDSNVCSYNKDSMQKAEYGRIYEYICRNDSSGVYYVQGQSDHEPFYKMCIRTNESINYWSFQQLDVFTNSRWLEFIKEKKVSKNLNESYTRSSFVYRAFMNFSRLLIKHFKIQTL